jgi:hypothetical protein
MKKAIDFFPYNSNSNIQQETPVNMDRTFPGQLPKLNVAGSTPVTRS